MASDDYATKVHIELTENQRFVATFPDLPGVAAITVDEAPPLGRAAGPNPAALLAAAVGNCLAASLLFDRRWAAGKDVRCPHNQPYDASRTETKTRYPPIRRTSVLARNDDRTRVAPRSDNTTPKVTTATTKLSTYRGKKTLSAAQNR
jgi:hypothetical protein